MLKMAEMVKVDLGSQRVQLLISRLVCLLLSDPRFSCLGLYHSGLDFYKLCFPNSLDGFLFCLYNQWEVLNCNVELEMEKRDR